MISDYHTPGQPALAKQNSMTSEAIGLGLVVIGVLAVLFFLYWCLRCLADACESENSVLALNNEDSRLDPQR